MAGKSQQECEVILHSISQTSLPTERQRVVSEKGDREIRIVLNQEVFEKLSRLKGLLGHALPNATLGELIEYMVDRTTEVVEQKKGLVPKKGTAQTNSEAVSAAAPAVESLTPKMATAKSPTLPVGRRVYLPIQLKHEVWKRSGGKCEYQSLDGRRCQATHRLEIDHITPLAMNGSNELNNLRILCQPHNLQQAMEKLHC